MPTLHSPVLRFYALCALACASMLACSSRDVPGLTSTDAAEDTQVPLSYATTLRETGLYQAGSTTMIAEGVVPYRVRYELWSDAAIKDRWVQIPKGTTFDTQNMNHWVAPVGTKVWKQFRLGDKRLETRLLHKQREGVGRDAWLMISYVWNEAQSDAIAQPKGAKNVLGTGWEVPPQEDCKDCHTHVKDVMNGVGAIQLSHEVGESDLKKWAAKGMLSHAPAREYLVPGNDVERAALGYLHGNCGHCHSDTSPLADRRTLRLRLRVEEGTVADTDIVKTTINQNAMHTISGLSVILKPGSPKSSQLYDRANRRDGYSMPPFGTRQVDTQGSIALEQWIASLKP